MLFAHKKLFCFFCGEFSQRNFKKMTDVVQRVIIKKFFLLSHQKFFMIFFCNCHNNKNTIMFAILFAALCLSLVRNAAADANYFLDAPGNGNCFRPLIPGAIIMGNFAVLNTTRNIVVKRNGVPLNPNDPYIAGEILSVSLSFAPTSYEYVFEASNSAFLNGYCLNQKRVAMHKTTPYGMINGVGSLVMPKGGSGPVNIWAGWTTAFAFPVKITDTFTLSDPGFTPTKCSNIGYIGCPYPTDLCVASPSTINCLTTIQGTCYQCSSELNPPSATPTNIPTVIPSNPSRIPTIKPTRPTIFPSVMPTNPTAVSTSQPTLPTYNPSLKPTTSMPSIPSTVPSFTVTSRPTNDPSTEAPTNTPSFTSSITPSSNPVSPPETTQSDSKVIIGASVGITLGLFLIFGVSYYLSYINMNEDKKKLDGKHYDQSAFPTLDNNIDEAPMTMSTIDSP